jgi:hypothetical protein
LRLRLGWSVAALLCLWVLAANVSPDFTPVRSELTDVRGFSRGILNLVVLSDSQPFTHAPAWSFAACAALFLILMVRLKPDTTNEGVRLKPDTTRETVDTRRPDSYVVSGFSRTVLQIMCIGAIGLLLAVAVSSYVTPYRVVLAPRTFALCVLLICIAGAFGAVRWLAGRWTPVASGIAGALFFASAMLQTLAGFGGNYSGFLHLSRDVAAQAPFLQERPDLARSLILYDAGYDGQFMYLMAFDPFLRRFADRPEAYRAFVDNPPYRYGRIGFSLFADLVSAGKPDRYPATMVWLIVAAHFALAALLATIAVRHGMSPFAGLWYLVIPSFTSSLMSALPEALAAAGIVAGFLCWEQRRPVLAAILFGAALLVRETGIILMVAVVVATGRYELKRSALVLAASLMPVCVWRIFVASRLFADFGWAAVVTNPGDLGMPFAGLLQLWQAGAAGAQPSPEIAGALVFPIILTAAFVLAVSLLVVRKGPLEIAATVYALVAVSLNYPKIWSHLPSGERGTFELFVCLLLLLLESRGRPIWIRRALTGFFLVLAAYTFFVAPDAGTSRVALLFIR